MSFSREGWRSQKVLAQVCRDCLSKRISTTSTPVLRRITTIATQKSVITPTTTTTKAPELVPSLKSNNTPATTTTPPTLLLENFRNELYHPTMDPPALSYSPLVRKAMLRRESRKRVLKAYRLMKKQQPALLSQLTQGDIDCFISKFTTNPDDPHSNGPCFEAYDILEDLKKGKLFRQAQFRLEDFEKMIYLATELKFVKKSVALLTEASIEKQLQVGISSYEAVIGLLATQKKQNKKIDLWLDHLDKLDMMPSKHIVRSVVLSRVASGQLDAAAHYLRRQHPTQDLAHLITRYQDDDDRELLDHALTMFAMDCLNEWRLNDMRLIYLRKRQCGMSTTVIVKNLINKSLHTGQIHTAQRMLADTIWMEDTANAQLCSKRLIQWYVSKKDIKHAVEVWEQMEKNALVMTKEVMEGLLVEAAKLKYNVDTMRLYRRCENLYPNRLSPEARVYVLRCMIRAKDFTNAQRLHTQVESMLLDMKPNLARTAVRSLFSLAAQTGNLALFERVFRTSEKLKLSLTHKGLTSLIACYLERGDVQSAKAAFQSVASHTDGPDVVDFNLLMRTVVMEDNRVDYDKIFDILTHMNLVNVTPDETTMRTMLGFYKSESDMQKSLYAKLLANPAAASRFDHVYLNNIALASLLTRMNVEEVVGILMRNNRGALFPTEANQRIHVNGLTYKMLLDAANKDNRYSSISERLLKDMEARGMKPTREVYERIIRNVAQKGKITKARRYIAKMEQDTGEKADVKTYTKLVDGLLYLGKPLLAKKIITQDMADNHIPIDDVVLEKLKKIESLLLKK